MISIIKLETPTAINHSQLITELGHPVTLHLDTDGLCVAVQVEDPYLSGLPGHTVEQRLPKGIDESAIRAAIDAHIADPLPEPTEDEPMEARMAALEAKILSMESEHAETKASLEELKLGVADARR